MTKTGDKVSGSYYGAPFTGTLRKVRPAYYNPETCTAVYVDTPGFVYRGIERDGIMWYGDEDGYHKDGCWINGGLV